MKNGLKINTTELKAKPCFDPLNQKEAELVLIMLTEHNCPNKPQVPIGRSEVIRNRCKAAAARIEKKKAAAYVLQVS